MTRTPIDEAGERFIVSQRVISVLLIGLEPIAHLSIALAEHSLTAYSNNQLTPRGTTSPPSARRLPANRRTRILQPTTPSSRLGAVSRQDALVRWIVTFDRNHRFVDQRACDESFDECYQMPASSDHWRVLFPPILGLYSPYLLIHLNADAHRDR